MTAAKIGFLCGSLREGSINKALENALIGRVKAAGAQTFRINLGEYDLPLYHGDIKTPAAVKKLTEKIISFDGVIITSPEYNGGLTPLLKNAIDWATTLGSPHITGPVYGIASCTPGPMSGIMSMRQTAYILGRIGCEVLPIQVGCGLASKAFDSNGQLISEPASTLADQMITAMIERITQKAA